MGQSSIIVVGAGVAGLSCALELAERGLSVEVVDRGAALGAASCSWLAGGMLAPWCERASTEEIVATLGAPSIDWWAEHYAGTVRNGSLVLAPPRDAGELTRFAQRTSGFDWVDEGRIASLEPDLSGRFRRGLFFASEAHLDPRRALAALADKLARLGVPVSFGVDFAPAAAGGRYVIDCRGLAARDTLADLRGVRGEMLLVRTRDVSLSRPVRMLHPRIPLYIVPRGDGLFMIGATMIENEERARVTARSLVELVNSAFVIHPAFAEAEIVETGSDVRPAFIDNLPRLTRRDRTLYINGLYRHGFLLAPALATRAAQIVCDGANFPELMDAHSGERAFA